MLVLISLQNLFVFGNFVKQHKHKNYSISKTMCLLGSLHLSLYFWHHFLPVPLFFPPHLFLSSSPIHSGLGVSPAFEPFRRLRSGEHNAQPSESQRERPKPRSSRCRRPRPACHPVSFAAPRGGSSPVRFRFRYQLVAEQKCGV